MRRFLLSCFALVVLALCCRGPVLAAGDDSDFKNLHPNAGGFPTAAPAPADSSADKVEKPAPTLAYAVAVLSAVIVLSIICVPSRKSESSTSR